VLSSSRLTIKTRVDEREGTDEDNDYRYGTWRDGTVKEKDRREKPKLGDRRRYLR
jgi:hypothetical protein